MDWAISRNSYYADFVLAPLALLASLFATGIDLTLVGGFLLGLAVWSAIEYGVHRWVFHRLYRREHFLHHKLPSRYIGVPWWQTSLAFLAAYAGSVGSFGMSLGSGLWDGVVAGYLLYIVVHDRYHHGKPKTWRGYWRDQYERHQVHHHGVEKNFGVTTPFWDIVVGSHYSV